MVTEDLVNLMEDDVSAKEAIDVKEKKESKCELDQVERKEEEQMW